MKKLILTFALILTCSAYTMQAQRVSVNINIGSQPAWGPVGYDYVDYYYMPDIDCYYSVNQGLFFYMIAGAMIVMIIAMITDMTEDVRTMAATQAGVMIITLVMIIRGTIRDIPMDGLIG